MVEYQLKSDTHGFFYSTSFKEIIKLYDETPNVVKISWSQEGIQYRYRPKTKLDKWCELSEGKISRLCSEYADAPQDKVFWVNQLIYVPQEKIEDATKDACRELTDDETSALHIVQVFTDEQFRMLFND